MKVLIISRDADGTGIAHQLSREGHLVYLWVKDQKFSNCLEGIVERPTSWRPYLLDSDLVICDSVGFSNLLPTFRRAGKPVLSCNPFGDVLELDRLKGLVTMQMAGIKVPPYQHFSSVEDARKMKWKNERGYVVKPHGNRTPATTRLCPSPAVFDWALSTYDKGQELIVQEIIDGVEVSTEGWFNGRDWITPFNHTFEEKRAMEGGKGQFTGCQGNVVIGAKKKNRLVEETLGLVKDYLVKIGYRGPIDLNCIVNEEGAWGLEWSTRPGYDAIEALMEGLKEPAGNLFFETAAGVKREMDLTNDYMIAVRVTTPPYPVQVPSEEIDKDVPIEGIVDANLKHLFFSDVKKVGDMYKSAGADGCLLKATAVGRSVEEAQNRVYRTVRNIKIPDVQYRRDIGERVDRDMTLLSKWGWLE